MTQISTPGYDRSIVEGPLTRAVWRLAWPTMLVNVIGGLQSLIDQVLVGHIVGYTGNAAIGVSNQVFIAVVIFVSSLFTGMSVLVSRFAGAGETDKVNRTVYQAFIAAVGIAVLVLAPLGYVFAPRPARLGQRRARRAGGGVAVPPHHAHDQQRDAGLLHAGRRAPLGGRRADADDPRLRPDGPQHRVQRGADPGPRTRSPRFGPPAPRWGRPSRRASWRSTRSSGSGVAAGWYGSPGGTASAPTGVSSASCSGSACRRAFRASR